MNRGNDANAVAGPRASENSMMVTDRRTVLGLGVGGVAALGLAASGCGGSSTGSKAASSAAEGRPVRGGTLKVAMTSGGGAEQLAPGRALTNTDLSRTYSLYENLFSVDKSIPLGVVPALAEAAESNSDGTVWTFRLRPGVEFHNGKSLTADDVIYSIRTWGDESFSYAPQAMQVLVDSKQLKKRDAHTVEVHLTRPVAQFPALTALFANAVIPDGFKDFTRPIGTGPFVFDSFEPGQLSVFQANKNYWESGKPYVDTLEIDSTFSDENARQQAALSGAADIIPILPFALAKASEASMRVEASRSTNPYYFACRVNTAPYNDPTVMQALKMLIDRDIMVETVFSGFAEKSNDLPDPNMQYFAESLPVRERDVERARSMLKGSGNENLELTCYVSPLQEGWVQAATLLIPQFAEGGVKLSLKKVNPEVFYTTTGGGHYRDGADAYPMAVDNAGNSVYSPALTSYYLTNLWTEGGYNETYFGDASTDNLMWDAIGETDEAKATDKWLAVQKVQYDEGGLICFGTPNYLDGYRSNVAGIKTTPAGWCNNFAWKEAWLTG